jgi:ALIX V-shaped domain binding to HIV
MPSSSLNAQLKAQLTDYQSKAQMAMSTDKQVEDKFAAHSEPLKLLTKTRQELSAMIP